MSGMEMNGFSSNSKLLFFGAKDRLISISGFLVGWVLHPSFINTNGFDG